MFLIGAIDLSYFFCIQVIMLVIQILMRLKKMPNRLRCVYIIGKVSPLLATGYNNALIS